MTAKRAVVLSFVAALALAAQPVLARSHRGGSQGSGSGSRGGGHHASAHARGGGGGSHATPRGGGGRAPVYGGGGIASARHPRAGGYYGYGGGHHPGYGGGHYYGHGHHGHGYYYGYPNYGFGGYYGSPYLSFSFGWPYSYPYGYGYSYPGYDPGDAYPGYDPPSADGGYDNGDQPPPPSDDTQGFEDRGLVARPQDADTGRLRLDVRPPDASVYVDGEFWGNAREATSLILRSGRHAIEVIRPGFDVARRDVDVLRGQTTDLRIELQHR